MIGHKAEERHRPLHQASVWQGRGAAPPVYRPGIAANGAAVAAVQPKTPASTAAPAVYRPAAVVNRMAAPSVFRPPIAVSGDDSVQAMLAGRGSPPVFRPVLGEPLQAKRAAPAAYRPVWQGTAEARAAAPSASAHHGSAPPAYVPRRGEMQRKASTAMAYIRKHNLKTSTNKVIATTQGGVTSFVIDTNNDKEHRIGLRRAWNKDQKTQYLIPSPPDLMPTAAPLAKVESLVGYDSDDDTKSEMSKFLENKGKQTIVRGENKNKRKFEAEQMSYTEAIRYGRRLAKEGAIKTTGAVIVTQLGDTMMEFSNPGTEDIYAFPLVKKVCTEKDKATPVTEYKREGGTSDFSFVNLVGHLKEQYPKVDDQKTAVRDVFEYVLGESTPKFTPVQSELAGAIDCDAMKGIRGAMFYVDSARKTLDVGTFSLEKMFTVPEPLYPPAKTKGRQLATRKTRELKLAKKAVSNGGGSTPAPTTGTAFVFQPPSFLGGVPPGQ